MPRGFFFEHAQSHGSKTPNKHKTFFENYADHLEYLESNVVAICEKLNESSDLNFLAHEAVKRISTFDALRDGYDYFDEIVGATIAPLVIHLASYYYLFRGVVEAACGFAIQANLLSGDKGHHFEEAQKYMMYAMTAFLLSFAIELKSLVSLVTRPIVTAFQGYKAQDVERFQGDSPSSAFSMG